jgi:multicomponent Na+:H+ antiporter subunit B
MDAGEGGAAVIPYLDTFFLLMILVTGVAALAVRDLLAAVILFGGFSFFSATFFASLGALDVAFTEASVGAAITTVLYVTVIFRFRRHLPRRQRPVRRAPAAAILVAFALAGVSLARAVEGLAPVGDANAPPARHVSPRYIESGPAETGAPNMVTAVLADYRGYDTLGETVVIFTAGLACLLILGATGRRAPPAP